MTIWVFGDQLNRSIGALATADPNRDQILMVLSETKLASRPWHRQRAHLLLASIHRFAEELRAEGFDVDLRRAPTLERGARDHLAETGADELVVTEPNSFDGHRLAERLGARIVASDQFLCHYSEFAVWAEGRRQLKLEDFYRWQRRRLGYLMDGDEPVGDRWNYDHDNRQRAPRDLMWQTPPTDALDDLDHEIIAHIDQYAPHCWGAPPDGTWATTRRGALERLAFFVEHVLPGFGPHEDAMVERSWHLAHSLLSPYLNLGLLLPGEACDAVEAAHRSGAVPIASAEGFIRQIIGWREYVWGIYWREMPEYRDLNHLGAHRPLPPVLADTAPTKMNCVTHAVTAVHDHAYAHHIQRLMVIGNLALLAGVDPAELNDWMWSGFIDGAEWVMLPNVIGMSQFADGGLMATKPYAAGGNYIDKMSDYCGSCAYQRSQRTGDDACPFTTLYWDFIARHADRFERNPRMARQVSASRRLNDLEAVRERAVQVLELLDRGEL